MLGRRQRGEMIMVLIPVSGGKKASRPKGPDDQSSARRKKKRGEIESVPSSKFKGSYQSLSEVIGRAEVSWAVTIFLSKLSRGGKKRGRRDQACIQDRKDPREPFGVFLQ